MRSDFDDTEDKTVNNTSDALFPHTSREVATPNRMMRVYIASPYTIGDVAVNVKAQIDCADDLMNRGFAPFWPLFSHFQHLVHPRPYEDWIKVDLGWVVACDALLRLPGPSKGADDEVKYANDHGIPVFTSVFELERYRAEEFKGD